MAKKDYSMGFKNRDIDRFANKFGKFDGGDEPKKKKTISEEDIKSTKVKAKEAYQKELESLQEGRPTPAKDKRIAELERKIGIEKQEKLKRTPGSSTAPTPNQIRQGNIKEIDKEIAEIIKKAKENGTLHLKPVKDQIEKLNKKKAVLKSKMN